MAPENNGQSGDTSDVGFKLEDLLDIRHAAEDYANRMILAGTTHGLTDEALRLVYVVIHPATGNSPRKWAELAGVVHMTYYRWRERPEFKAAVEQLREQRKTDFLAKADKALEQLLMDSDPAIRLRAVRTIYQKAGEFVTRIETTRVTETAEERMKRIRARDSLQGNSQVPNQDEQKPPVN